MSSVSPEINVPRVSRKPDSAWPKPCKKTVGLPQAAQLIAISKTKSATEIRAAFTGRPSSVRGNRVQEAKTKWPPLKAQYGDVELHLVGPLQTNKVKEAVALFDVIQTLDREKLARKLAELKGESSFPRLLIQVNTGDEPQKSGVTPSELAAFYALCRMSWLYALTGLCVCRRKVNRPGRILSCSANWRRNWGWDTLSMGMSGDFETALALGATHISTAPPFLAQEIDFSGPLTFGNGNMCGPIGVVQQKPHGRMIDRNAA